MKDTSLRTTVSGFPGFHTYLIKRNDELEVAHSDGGSALWRIANDGHHDPNRSSGRRDDNRKCSGIGHIAGTQFSDE